ncbi:UDP-N-acetylmuramoylalanine--D-glutamate ligase [Candidatus Roizmanbacteria bacterium RIFCSPLOWO2_12_FULL_40_12]|uniref:UDP-N-acetylmuramoylalanine--D-glutamate ligase n=1 Tax=Candidatus Roizmanbacteria bacterium RIFCSPLOWO2_01_FULL_40_42 TaxID=1802066 RepID=A0A1F7J4T2_9BACT|nr:MAG: UDP-N-acetylmuramoylalanine--D-glutamate ligase [Candidatus Roizmanbacteria bacterium RIFCSPHIGHO2_01_FULL_40_98]OGK27394.1 MAG: UDP-N-acetylmuramoylalanine--D-glutamate ligase [Candidatus Roizmanbacteria bacterium RIFCSPHIGHO2_02_FULL_40_53]OGK30733.1 MAG: UDP-N-acetylmuramoylalanine--D-glutamate ligase [Candidatus Roizmanbacteria bacterium RIFCSPHIGHO2_12_41_18]OGK36183.1 MAG: UDP-N-acetylmuramoylalanine--D-glutamate ligase [Candidatus Roizmanbacteria bacterium RIFCSPHIGHO2_12_FULL_40_
MKNLSAKKVLILGYGREGKSTHKFLSKYFPDVKISVADEQELSPTPLGVENKYTGKDYLKHLSEFELVIKSPGIPTRLPEIQKYLKENGKITSHMNLFFENYSGVAIGVTGSKGKSTTSSLIHTILKEKYDDVRFGGNIGLPALDLINDSNDSTIFVLELSSFQLEYILYSPHIAVLLDIFPGHLDVHPSFEDYVAAKRNILTFQKKEDFMIYNPKHSEVDKFISESQATKYTYSSEDQSTNCFIKDENIYFKNEEGEISIMPVKSIPLIGHGNLENTLAAVLVLNLLGVSKKQIQKGIANFKPLEHRLEFVAEKNGVRYYDDSIASVPEAAIHAIQALGNKVETLIAGGHNRNQDLKKLVKTTAQSQIKNLILFPETGKLMEKEMKKERTDISTYHVNSMKEAVLRASEVSSPGTICLLSPGSPSFGLFKNFEDRGAQFKEEVKKLS